MTGGNRTKGCISCMINYTPDQDRSDQLRCNSCEARRVITVVTSRKYSLDATRMWVKLKTDEFLKKGGVINHLREGRCENPIEFRKTVTTESNLKLRIQEEIDDFEL